MNRTGSATIETTVNVPEGADMALITGPGDSTLRYLEDAFGVHVAARGDTVRVTGASSSAEACGQLIEYLAEAAVEGRIVDDDELRRTAETLQDAEFTPAQLLDDVVHTYRGRVVRPKTAGQKRYVDAIRTNSITFGLGPAGTGKTFLACAMAAAGITQGTVKRIILCRPIVEAGESLGYLPGTLMEKVDPYIRPLYDALFDMLDTQRANRLLADGVIEIVPLAYMRGRTFNNSFVILDEAQNATPEQMKLFLTRLGNGTKMVVTGDESQSDFAAGATGLANARHVLKDIDGIGFVTLDGRDVIRHQLVAKIIAAYERQ